MNVGMKQQVLAPRVKNAEETNLGSEMLGVACHLAECFSDGAEQQVVKLGLILQNERVEFVRQREDDVEVARKCCRQHLCVYVLFPVMWRSVMAPLLEGHAVDFETT